MALNHPDEVFRGATHDCPSINLHRHLGDFFSSFRFTHSLIARDHSGALKENQSSDTLCLAKA